MTDLSGRVVAVTGASSGIGEATALACAKAGAAVAFAARRSERIEDLARRIEADGGQALAFTADVGEEQQANAFIRAAHERFGRLDALVNNAGVMLLGPIDGAPTEEWRRMIHANVFGVLYCTHAALPLMKAQGARRHRDRQLRRRARDRPLLRDLQPDEVRRRRVRRGAAPGERRHRPSRHADRARPRRHRVAHARPRGGHARARAAASRTSSR